MARRDATFGEVFDAIQARLIDQLGLHERSALLVIDAETPPIPQSIADGSGSYLAIAPGEMQYMDYWGEPQKHCTVSAGIRIASSVRIWLDDANQDYQAMFHAERGLLTNQRLIVKALANHDLLLADGSTFLSELLRPIGSARPQQGFLRNDGSDEEEIPVYFQFIDFVCTFDLDLTN